MSKARAARGSRRNPDTKMNRMIGTTMTRMKTGQTEEVLSKSIKKEKIAFN